MENEMKNNFLDNFFLEIFNLNEVKPDDDFFVLGGSSLLLPQLIHNIWVNTGVHLEAKDIFATRSIKEISALIEEKIRNKESAYLTLNPSLNFNADIKYVNMSYPQRHIWLSEKLSALEDSYNVGFTFTIKGDIEIDRLKESITQVIMEEDNYNLIFLMKSGELVCETKTFTPEIIIYEHVKEVELEEHLHTSVKTKKFSLDEGPLFKIEIHKLIDVEDTVKIFFLFHHIIIDQYSVPLLWNAIFETYSSQNRYQKPSSFKECILNSSEALLSGAFDQQKEYWRSQFMNLDMEKLNKFKKKKKHIGYSRIKRVRNKKSTNILKENFDNNTVFLTIYLESISSYFFKENRKGEFIVGIPYANRHGINSANCQGFFVNIIPFKVEFPFNLNSDSFHYIRQKNEITFQNQNYPFEFILNEIDFKTASQRQNFIDNVFIYEKQIELKKDGRKFKDVSYDELNYTTPMFPLNLYLVENEEQYTINFDFDSSFITHEDATAFLSVFENNIDKVEEGKGL
ncbi:hypothetical protein CN281_11235 [Bacillus cereus]|nr:hypothetical protein CN281_11235 [Bacillus cereus]PFH95724.1 hypothetical protein COI78_08555 [Bacillus cereus]